SSCSILKLGQPARTVNSSGHTLPRSSMIQFTSIFPTYFLAISVSVSGISTDLASLDRETYRNTVPCSPVATPLSPSINFLNSKFSSKGVAHPLGPNHPPTPISIPEMNSWRRNSYCLPRRFHFSSIYIMSAADVEQ